VALIGEPGLLRNQREGLMGPAQQGFCALEPALDDIALRPNPGRLFESAAKVVGAQTGDVGEDGEREVFIETRLDIVVYAPQPLRRKALSAARQGEMAEKTPSNADTQRSAQAFDQDPVRETTLDLPGQGGDDLAQQGVLQRIQEVEPRCYCSKLRQQRGVNLASQTT